MTSDNALKLLRSVRAVAVLPTVRVCDDADLQSSLQKSNVWSKRQEI